MYTSSFYLVVRLSKYYDRALCELLLTINREIKLSALDLKIEIRQLVPVSNDTKRNNTDSHWRRKWNESIILQTKEMKQTDTPIIKEMVHWTINESNKIIAIQKHERKKCSSLV